ncbi:hypothetical protein, conserved [Leishmania tarentolae]|uniref:Uncharacterized protein n=1 Tax=Leishmania tarentolae TaxID=5689 RepID=A0A640KCR8_LEITA|nr:hypothetical protein, conserved [Leishmania tarentolae]
MTSSVAPFANPPTEECFLCGRRCLSLSRRLTPTCCSVMKPLSLSRCTTFVLAQSIPSRSLPVRAVMRLALARRGLMPPPRGIAVAVAAAAVSVRSSRGTHIPHAIASPVRHLSNDSASSSSPADRSQGSYKHFQQQQQLFHRHSFYEKGSSAPRDRAGSGAGGKQAHGDPVGDSGNSGGSSSSSTATEQQQRERDERLYGMGSATAQQRRQVRQHWEKSFFGRLHYEEGMQSRFAEALKSEEEEAFRQLIAGQSHADLFPRWPEDEEAPLSEFKRLRPSLQLHYITNRLSSGERRIRYAADFGGLLMMSQLNLGEMMIKEADMLLRELGWMNEEVSAKIEEVQALASKTKFDFDLD